MKYFIASVLVLAAVGLALLVWPKEAHTNPMQTIQIGSSTVAVDVADTESLRERGLSGRASLAEGRGMLFIFDTDGLWPFWMKDMRFPIDIIWADARGKVVTVLSNLAPDTYPQSFAPMAPARYVLEVPAGFAAAHGIAEGVVVVQQ